MRASDAVDGTWAKPIVHLLVHADRSVIEPRGLQGLAHPDGLFLDLITELRRTRRGSSGPGFEHRRLTVVLGTVTQHVERFPGDVVLVMYQDIGDSSASRHW